jgi:pimeloyl-ACP methyl ester carboxylesterase
MIAAVKSHGTRIVELASGHQTFEEAPADYKQAVLRFLALVTPAPPPVIAQPQRH